MAYVSMKSLVKNTHLEKKMKSANNCSSEVTATHPDEVISGSPEQHLDVISFTY